MHLTIFGASGRTGRHLVRLALDQGHHVTAFVRDPDKLARVGVPVEHEHLRIVQGDVTDAEPVHEAVAGADAVLSALGHAKGSPKDVQTVGTRHILDAMDRHGVDRLISETGAGVPDPKDADPSLGARFMRGLMQLIAADVLQDAEQHADLIRQSEADWTLVRAPRLTEGPQTGVYEAGYMDLGAGAKISRADVADFMLTLATDGGYHREAPKVVSR